MKFNEKYFDILLRPLVRDRVDFETKMDMKMDIFILLAFCLVDLSL